MGSNLFRKKQNSSKTNLFDSNNLTYRNLLAFFLPLGLSSLTIAMSNLMLTRCLGYFPDSEMYISSFSVARTIVNFVQSPGFVATYLIATFVTNEYTFLKIKKFLFVILLLVVTTSITVAYTPLSKFIFENLFNISGELLSNAITSLKVIIFFAMIVLVRLYFLGIAIKLRKLRFATLGSTIRLVVITIFSFFIPELLNIFGPKYLPGILLLIMAFVEASVYAFGVLKVTRGKITKHVIYSLKQQNIYSPDDRVSYGKLLKFAIPFILSFIIAQLLPGFTQSALALSENNVIILAVYTISSSVAFIISSFSFQLPQLVVNHESFIPNNRKIIIRFCFILAGISTIALALVGFTKVGDFVFVHLLKVSESSTSIAKLACKFAILQPASSMFMTYKRGKLLKVKRTNMLIFERLIGSLLPYSLMFIIPLINWQYSAAVGILMTTLANFFAGLFLHIVFKINVRKDPELITHKS